MKSKLLISLIASSLLMSISPVSSFAAEGVTSSTSIKVNSLKSLKQLLPNKAINNLSEGESEELLDATSAAIINVMTLVNAGSGEEWTNEIKQGKFKVKRVVPVYDLDNQLIEAMVTFKNGGYVIVDIASGQLKQFSYGAINDSYLVENDLLYVNGQEHFGVKDNKVVDGNKKGFELATVKEEYKRNKKNLNNQSYVSDNSIISTLDEKTKQEIAESFLTGSTNDGSTSSYITEPITFYKKYWAIRNKTVTSLATVENIILNVPELNQSNLPFITESYSNDCAIVATIEIMSYYYPSLTNAQKKIAYNAMINSTYFNKPDNGVMFNDNNQLFKVAVESLKLGNQDTSDDEENYFFADGYDNIRRMLVNYGPIYLSLNQDPYPNHTLTVKGILKYDATVTDNTTLVKTSGTTSFIRVNDHWAVTATDAFMYIPSLGNTPYWTAIKKN
ncbi:hypothetical protein EJP77_02255 [Paenibacillus zeisoli]|uniref:Peptidase C39-like domain-containing protein n=1 Tax=Paenibacillus zeisoli TaxID=2496267 RepID=A0A3S1D9N9_9BACL|nr:hypothetical protein [Paenibacillus zeisoli]RUT35851.1 hypothetical protein EJP77_02255 [Paenibacillus zeisoli]